MTTTNPTPSKTNRTALYARVSTTGHGQDVGLQLDELRAVAGQRGWHVVADHVDDGVSGAATSRPGLDEMMEQARRGKLDLVVVWKLDRLGRSLQHLLQILDELQHFGVGFVSITDSGIDTTTASDRLMLHILGAVAAYELDLIRERTRAGVWRARDCGKTFGRSRRDLDLRAARVLLDQGRSVRDVADMLGLPRSTHRRGLGELQVGGPEVPSEHPLCQRSCRLISAG
jgi:DNA invertase Pin-like site-specific DNA recombinase